MREIERRCLASPIFFTKFHAASMDAPGLAASVTPRYCFNHDREPSILIVRSSLCRHGMEISPDLTGNANRRSLDGSGPSIRDRIAATWCRRVSVAEIRLQEGESLENALRRFKRKVQSEDIIREVKRHSYYLKPGERRRVKQALARKRARKKSRKEGSFAKDSRRE